MTRRELSENVAICLVEPRKGGNIGAAARAMKNMGLSRLVLVRPPDLDTPEARMMSAGARDVLKNAVICSDLREAVAPFSLAVSTTTRLGQDRYADFTPKTLARRVNEHVAGGNGAVIVFGREDKGLTQAEIDLAPRIVTIPATKGYSSLNLAQAVLVIAYEIYCETSDVEPEEFVPSRELADADQLERFFEQAEPLLLECGFLDASNPEWIMRTLRKITHRARLNHREVKILRGICSDMEWYLDHVAETGGGMVSVRWTGAAGLEIRHEGRVFLVDPYHSRPGKWDLLVGTPLPRNDVVDAYLDGLPAKPSAVIAGHTHVDHVLDFPHLAKRLDCPIIGSRSLDTLFQIYGLPNRVRVTEGRERIELADGASVTPIPTIHGLVLFGRVPYPGEIEPGGAPPLKTKRFRHGQVFMLLLEIGGVRFLHTGSANLVDEELENVGCDVLFMCIPGWNKIDDYHGRLLGRVRPKVVIPFHFDDFTKPWRADRSAPELPFLAKDGFLAAVKEKAPDAKVIYPKTWEWMEF